MDRPDPLDRLQAAANSMGVSEFTAYVATALALVASRDPEELTFALDHADVILRLTRPTRLPPDPRLFAALTGDQADLANRPEGT